MGKNQKTAGTTGTTLFFKEIGWEHCWEPSGNRLDAICLIYIKVPIGFPLDSHYGSRCAGNKINGVPVVPAIFAVLASGVRARDAILSDFLPLRIAHILFMFTCLAGRILGHSAILMLSTRAGQCSFPDLPARLYPPLPSPSPPHKKPPVGGLSRLWTDQVSSPSSTSSSPATGGWAPLKR